MIGPLQPSDATLEPPPPERAPLEPSPEGLQAQPVAFAPALSADDFLLVGLRQLAARFTAVLAGVCGGGSWVKIELHALSDSRSFLLRFLSSQEHVASLATSYLRHVHRIGVEITRTGGAALRLEPATGLDGKELARILGALEELCTHLAAGDALALTRHLADGADAATSESVVRRSELKPAYHDEPRFRQRQCDVPAARVAWLCHLVDADDLVSLEPSFRELSFQQREDYLARLVAWGAPVVLSAVDVQSATGERVRLYPILLPFTSHWIKCRIDQRRLAAPQALIQQGVDLAHALGCQVVSLGQYTSIATRNGTRLDARGLGVTTGNSYAVALALEAIERAQREMGRQSQESVLVVAGALGNIGQVCAEILAPRFRRTILIGTARPGSHQRLQALAARLPNAVPTTDLSAASEGDVVLAALNAVDAPLSAIQFAPNAIVCDLSVPASLTRSAVASRPDVRHLKGGIAALPFREDLEIVDFPLPRGQTYGCMAEALLLGLDGVRDATFTGSLTPGHVARIAALAARHGFTLADYRRFCVLGTEREETACAKVG